MTDVTRRGTTDVRLKVDTTITGQGTDVRLKAEGEHYNCGGDC